MKYSMLVFEVIFHAQYRVSTYLLTYFCAIAIFNVKPFFSLPTFITEHANLEDTKSLYSMINPYIIWYSDSRMCRTYRI